MCVGCLFEVFGSDEHPKNVTKDTEVRLIISHTRMTMVHKKGSFQNKEQQS
jgi:hypothetical protein